MTVEYTSISDNGPTVMHSSLFLRSLLALIMPACEWTDS